MKLRILFNLIIISLLSTLSLAAQEDNDIFNITGVNTDEFPTVKSYFIAKKFQTNNNFYSPVLDVKNPQGFDVTENGVSKDETSLYLRCRETEEDLPVHVSVIMDASGSMFEGGEEKADIARKATDAFIDSLNFDNGSSISLVMFGGQQLKAYPADGWRSSAQEAKESLGFYDEISGATNFNTGFYKGGPKSGIELLKQKPPTERRVILFFTDGRHEVQNEDFQYELISEMCREEGIEVYVVLFSTNDYTLGLDYVANSTGGLYEKANSERELIDLFKLITNNLTTKTLCWLEWESELSCDEVTQRDVSVTFKESKSPIERTFNYTPSEDQGLASISSDATDLYFDPNGATNETVTLTADKGDFTVTGYNITNNTDNRFVIPEIDNAQQGITLNQGEQLQLTVQYTNKGEVPTLSELNIITDLCPVNPIELIAPCGNNAENVQFDDVPLSTGKNITIENILENNSPKPITGTLSLEGTNSDEFEILTINGIAGPDYTLNPGESLNLELSCTPNSTGQKTAIINFGYRAECGSVTANINANVFEASLALQPYDFGERRIVTENTYTYTIENSSENDITIDDISLTDNSEFELSDIANSLITLSPGESTTIDITFNPNQEGNYNTELRVNLENVSNPAISSISGTGFLPQLTNSPVNFPATDINTDANDINLTLGNDSDFGPLTISEIRIKDGTNDENDFSLDLSGFTPGSEIRDDVINIPVSFNPKAPGLRTATIVVVADNIQGPNPIEPVENEIEISGIGEGGAIVDLGTLDFGQILSCEQKSLEIEIENNSATVSNAEVVINQSEMNFIASADNFNISGNSSQILEIIYVPQSIGTHNGDISITLDNGITYTASLIGEATTQSVDIVNFGGNINNGVYEVILGETAEVTMSLPLNQYDIRISNSNELRFNFSYNSSVLGLANANIVDANFAIDDITVEGRDDENDTGSLSLIIEGDIPLNQTLQITVRFNTFYGNATGSDLAINTSIEGVECLSILPTSTRVNLIGCNLDNTTIGNVVIIEDYAGIIGENPVSTSLELFYQVPYKAEAIIEIVDVAGNVVDIPVNEILNEGKYTISIDTRFLSGGIYFFRYRVGNITDTGKFMKLQ